MHVSVPYKQAEDRMNVIRLWCRELVILFAKQLFAFVANEFAEAVRNIDVSSLAVDHSRVIGSDLRTRGDLLFQFKPQAFGRKPRFSVMHAITSYGKTFTTPNCVPM